MMTTIKTAMHQLTDATSIMQAMKDTLRKIDPGFPEKEADFLQAASGLEQKLGDSVSPSASDFLAAMEQNFVSSLIYIGWQGLQLNLDIFQNPVNALRLESSFEDLHQERRLATIPTVGNARSTICAFYEAIKQLPEDVQSHIDDISAFYADLETIGYKLAHYFGFRLGNAFLHHVIPGYIHDDVHTGLYTMALQDYLNTDLGFMN